MSLGPAATREAARHAEGGLRLLLVGNMYPPHHSGGYELVWQQSARHARALGHQVRILTSVHGSGSGVAEEDPDVHRTLRWYWDPERYAFPTLTPWQRLAVERGNRAELLRHLSDFRPDLVAWWSMGCMSLSLIEQVRRRGLPQAYVVHDDWLVYGFEHDQWLRMWRGARRWLAPLAERVFGVPTEITLGPGRFVFNSRYILERALPRGVPAEQCVVVHPGIDERLLSAARSEAPWRWRLAYIGRIDRQKGIHTAVTALSHLPEEATLAIWGTGDECYLQELREHAERLGVAARVHPRGFAGPEELPDAYLEADAIVFPVTWEEPFGLVPLEAMALQRPVVTTMRGGTEAFVRDGENALVFPAGDAAALAARVERLAGDPELRRRLAAHGRQTAARYPAVQAAAETVREMLSGLPYAVTSAR